MTRPDLRSIRPGYERRLDPGVYVLSLYVLSLYVLSLYVLSLYVPSLYVLSPLSFLPRSQCSCQLRIFCTLHSLPDPFGCQRQLNASNT
jgi:hypothetical protein